MLETLADGVAEACVTCRALQVLRREALEAAVVADGAVLEGILRILVMLHGAAQVGLCSLHSTLALMRALINASTAPDSLDARHSRPEQGPETRHTYLSVTYSMFLGGQSGKPKVHLRPYDCCDSNHGPTQP